MTLIFLGIPAAFCAVVYLSAPRHWREKSVRDTIDGTSFVDPEFLSHGRKELHDVCRLSLPGAGCAKEFLRENPQMAYDTIGEATVLFTSIVGAFVILRRRGRKRKSEEDAEKVGILAEQDIKKDFKGF